MYPRPCATTRCLPTKPAFATRPLSTAATSRALVATAPPKSRTSAAYLPLSACKRSEGALMNGTIGKLLLQRLALGVVTLLIVSVVVFMITNLLPGDAAEESLGQAATPEAVAALRAQFGLDQPGPLRYLRWLGHLVTG